MTADTIGPVERDERTEVFENSSYRYGYLVATFGMLLAVIYRAFYLQDPAWDLLGLVIAAGMVVTVVQARGRILGRRWALTAVVAVLAAAAVALVVVGLLFRR